MFAVEEAGGKALPCILDVRDEQQVKAAVKSAVQTVYELIEGFAESKSAHIDTRFCLVWWHRHPGQQCQCDFADANT